MARCGNCGAKLSCSCKMRKASDGKSCCVNCISNYEKIIKKSKVLKTLIPDTIPGIILNTTAVQT